MASQDIKAPWQMTRDEIKNWDIKVPAGGGSKSPKAVFSWAKDDYETLYDLSKSNDTFRFNEVLGKGYADWKPSLYLREKIKKNEPITIYRASEEGDIVPGSYVSESLEYVKWHQENIMQGKGKIFSKTVKPSELMIYGDPHEFIYIPESVESYHKQLIQQALSEGKPVPAEVLKDYPGLNPRKGPLYPHQPPRKEPQYPHVGKKPSVSADSGTLPSGTAVRIKSSSEGWINGTVVDYYDVISYPALGMGIVGGGMTPGYKVRVLEGKHKGETLRVPANYVQKL